MDMKRFKIGGVHPAENKFSAAAETQVLSLPSKVIIPMGQHIGAPAVPLVKKGDSVKAGTLIGRGESFISANIHSSVSGTVKAVEDSMDASGYKRKSVIIDVQGDEWEESIDRSCELKKEIDKSSQEIVDIIKDSGIVGLGGACFPTHVKYMIPPDKRPDSIIINAVECEPYLTADHRLMLEKPEEILVGTAILMKAAEVDRAYIGIEANKPDAIELLKEKSADYNGIEVIPLRVQYPQGAEKQLIKAALNREVPGGKLPLDVGCIVNNVGTAFAVYEAVQKNKPLIERIVTVTGKSVKTPSNLLVRTGTLTEFMVNSIDGGAPEDYAKVISGGPMMGKALSSLDVPVTKGTSGILFMNREDAERNEAQTCIRCAKCVSVCPMGLEPYLLEQYAAKDMFEECEEDKVTDCIECGSCSYICPSSRPLLDYIRYGKANVMRIMRERSVK